MEGGCILRYEAVHEETAKAAAEEQLRMTGDPPGIILTYNTRVPVAEEVGRTEEDGGESVQYVVCRSPTWSAAVV